MRPSGYPTALRPKNRRLFWAGRRYLYKRPAFPYPIPSRTRKSSRPTCRVVLPLRAGSLARCSSLFFSDSLPELLLEAFGIVGGAACRRGYPAADAHLLDNRAQVQLQVPSPERVLPLPVQRGLHEHHAVRVLVREDGGEFLHQALEGTFRLVDDQRRVEPRSPLEVLPLLAEQRGGLCPLRPEELHRRIPGAAQEAGDAVSGIQIGRASCRERG